MFVLGSCWLSHLRTLFCSNNGGDDFANHMSTLVSNAATVTPQVPGAGFFSLGGGQNSAGHMHQLNGQYTAAAHIDTNSNYFRNKGELAKNTMVLALCVPVWTMYIVHPPFRASGGFLQLSSKYLTTNQLVCWNASKPSDANLMLLVASLWQRPPCHKRARKQFNIVDVHNQIHLSLPFLLSRRNETEFICSLGSIQRPNPKSFTICDWLICCPPYSDSAPKMHS